MPALRRPDVGHQPGRHGHGLRRHRRSGRRPRPPALRHRVCAARPTRPTPTPCAPVSQAVRAGPARSRSARSPRCITNSARSTPTPSLRPPPKLSIADLRHRRAGPARADRLARPALVGRARPGHAPTRSARRPRRASGHPHRLRLPRPRHRGRRRRRSARPLRRLRPAALADRDPRRAEPGRHRQRHLSAREWRAGRYAGLRHRPRQSASGRPRRCPYRPAL